MNGKVCCLLGVCCPPRSQERKDALAHELESGTGLEKSVAATTAEWILDNFDLAPIGTSQAVDDLYGKQFASKLNKK